MKKFLQILGISVLFVIFAFSSCGCDSDQDVPGNNSFDIIGESDSGDKLDVRWSPPDGWSEDDVFEDDAEEEADAGQSLDEFCGQFVGLWDCTVVGGYNEGFFVIILIKTLNVLEYQHTLWAEYVNPTGSQGTFVCKGTSPAETGTGGYFYPPDEVDDVLTFEVVDSLSPSMSYTMECVPHPTD